MWRFTPALVLTLFISCKTSQTTSQSGDSSSLATQTSQGTIQDFVQGMERFDGYFNFYYDHKMGNIWLEIDKLNTEFLYVNSLRGGVGSNDIGLDRGQLGDTRVVKFQRSGPKIMLVQPNYDYRAISNNEDERVAVEQAFAQSVLWGFDVMVEEDWKVLVNMTDFLLRDAHGIADRLSATGQGKYGLDRSRSALYMAMTKNFPENSEFEATVTFGGKAEGDWVKSVVPSPDAVTVSMHHSFIQLPDSNYKPRVFDPRAGYNFIKYQDYATPIDEPLVKRFIRRHRLIKKDPGASMSEAIEPIIYYVDRGAPEPIKSALLDGARWWNQAFEAAGFDNAFQVKEMPEGADLMDVRYNVIQWVHRSTRGWSYGSSVTDPRTGEIIKGHVTLGSLRVRQDFLIAEGLLAPYGSDNTPEDMLEMALARLRQLSAHEVGHTLGIVHNFASSKNGRASVMDYPHPFVRLSGDQIDLSEAYDTDIGEWDKQVIKYGYSQFPEGANEKTELEKVIQESLDRGLLHISDSDARPRGGAHPYAHLWDNGNDPADELNRMMKIRSKIISEFSSDNIRAGAPMSNLEEAFVPMYLFHRYQIEAAAKVLGGLNYSFALKGDGQTVTSMISPDMQKKALSALINTISAESLALPESLLEQIPPRAFGYPRTRETFKARTGPTFDALGIVETASNMTLSFVFHPHRAGRLVEYKSRDGNQPGLEFVIDEVIAATWKKRRKDDYKGEVMRSVDKVVLYNLIQLAADNRASEQARATTLFKLKELSDWMKSQESREKNSSQKAHLYYSSVQLEQFLQDPEDFEMNTPIGPPDGSPIGSGEVPDQLCEWN